MQQSNNELFYSGPQSKSQRVLYTPSSFARSSLLYLQETGTLTAIKPHTSSRTNLSSYLFFVVLSGSGWLEYPAAPGESGCDGHRGERYEMYKGCVAFIDCKHGYSQSSSAEAPWTLSWCHWNGSNMPAVYNKYSERGGKCVFHPSDPTSFTSLLDKLYETASGSSFVRDVEINVLLNELIGMLFQETVYEEGQQPAVGEYKGAGGTAAINVGQIKTYIDTHYQEQLSLEGLAEHFHFNKNYVSRRFKEKFGMSVGGYIGVVRVGRAKMMLRFSTLSIEEIGLECGYSDPNFFSRTFKKVEGVSPSEYRRNWMSGNSSDSGNGDKELGESVDNTVESK